MINTKHLKKIIGNLYEHLSVHYTRTNRPKGHVVQRYYMLVLPTVKLKVG
jgi:hypothetical protein